MAIDNKQITCGIFLDLSKAFDTVNHNILLSKLYAYGIRGIRYGWFENYLYQRTQYVNIDDSKSNMETIVCGIPQGSTSGPLLLIVFFAHRRENAKIYYTLIEILDLNNI